MLFGFNKRTQRILFRVSFFRQDLLDFQYLLTGTQRGQVFILDNFDLSNPNTIFLFFSRMKRVTGLKLRVSFLFFEPLQYEILNRHGAPVPFSEATPVKQRQNGFTGQAGQAKSAKGFISFLIRTNDQKKNHALTGRPLLELVQANCERCHPAVTMSFLACLAS